MLACPATVCRPYSWLSTTFTTRGCACVSSIGMNYKPKEGCVRPFKRKRLSSPSLPRASYHREEEGGRGEVGILLEVADGFCPQGLFPTFQQELGAAHLGHVPKAPGHDLSEQGRGQNGLEVTCSRKHAKVRNEAVSELGCEARPRSLCPVREQAGSQDLAAGCSLHEEGASKHWLNLPLTPTGLQAGTWKTRSLLACWPHTVLKL